MNLQDPATLNAFMAHVEDQWKNDDHEPARPGWMEQTDEAGGYRVLLATVKDLAQEGKRLRVFKVLMSSHHASPIYYVFSLKGSGDACARTAHYILSHQRSLAWREWFCGTTQRSVPHLGTYRGDLSLVGPTFRGMCEA
jgi:hypothetical protein